MERLTRILLEESGEDDIFPKNFCRSSDAFGFLLAVLVQETVEELLLRIRELSLLKLPMGLGQILVTGTDFRGGRGSSLAGLQAMAG